MVVEVIRFKEETDQKQRIQVTGEGVDGKWKNMKEALLRAAANVYGETKGGRTKREEQWLWNLDVQEAIRQKNKAIKV